MGRKLCVSVPCPFLQPRLLPGSRCLAVFLPPQHFASSLNGPQSFAWSWSWQGLFPLAGHSSRLSHLYLLLPTHLPFLQGGIRGKLHVHRCHRMGGLYDFLLYHIITLYMYWTSLGFPWWLSSKECAYNAGDLSLIPGLGRSPGEGNGSPF